MASAQVGERSEVGRAVRFLRFVAQRANAKMTAFFPRLVEFTVPTPAPLWTPRVPDGVDAATRASLEAEYSGKFEYRLFMTNGGRALRIKENADADMATRYHLLVQSLRIVQFLTHSGIVDADLHCGNFLVRGHAAHDFPLLTLVDFDDMYFQGDPEYDGMRRNFMMLAQVSGMMANVPQTHAATAEHREYGATIPEFEEAAQVIRRAKPDLARAIDNWVSAAGVDADADLVVAMHYDLVKARYPDLHRTLHRLPPSSPVPVWFPSKDFEFLYAHVRDIDAIVNYFSGRLVEELMK